MAPTTLNKPPESSGPGPGPGRGGEKPCVLVVDDESSLRELAGDVLGGRGADLRVLSASNLRDAQELIRLEDIQLMLVDMQLPDGNGMSLLPLLRDSRPTAEAVVITGHPSLQGAIDAMRAGVIDLLPKPFSAAQLRERVERALQRQAIVAKTDKRLRRLRRAVRRLNLSRRVVSKKVDLLCNDLVAAYGELSRQLDGVRTQESFRKLADSARDLEQLLCHAMDWILRHTGYSNVAIWLAADEGENELGAYMKYTIPGEKEFTDSMKQGLLPLIAREGFVHLDPEDLPTSLTEAECDHLVNQTVLGVNCTYLGETLATIIVFRDARSPFTDEDGAMLKAISPIFATALANTVRKGAHHDLDEDGNPFYDDSGNDAPENNRSEDAPDEDEERDRERRERKDRHAADWWKRGEPPPF
jgi:FixJ family two-component response regulator